MVVRTTSRKAVKPADKGKWNETPKALIESRLNGQIDTIVEMPISEIEIGQRFRKDMGDIRELAERIKRLGMLHPVIVNPEKKLIAGARRIKAAQVLGWETIPARVMDLTEFLRAEYDENSARKDFAPSEAVAISRALAEEEKKLARERQAHGQTAPGRRSGKLSRSEEAGRAKTRIAKLVGMSRPTLHKAEKVIEAAEKEPAKFGPVAEEMDRTGKVDSSYQMIVASTTQANPLSPPDMGGIEKATSKLRDRLDQALSTIELDIMPIWESVSSEEKAAVESLINRFSKTAARCLHDREVETAETTPTAPLTPLGA